MRHGISSDGRRAHHLRNDNVIRGVTNRNGALQDKEHQAELQNLVRGAFAIGMPAGQQPGMLAKQKPAIEHDGGNRSEGGGENQPGQTAVQGNNNQ